jgi:hypothetical protein
MYTHPLSPLKCYEAKIDREIGKCTITVGDFTNYHSVFDRTDQNQTNTISHHLHSASSTFKIVKD